MRVFEGWILRCEPIKAERVSAIAPVAG